MSIGWNLYILWQAPKVVFLKKLPQILQLQDNSLEKKCYRNNIREITTLNSTHKNFKPKSTMCFETIHTRIKVLKWKLKHEDFINIELSVNHHIKLRQDNIKILLEMSWNQLVTMNMTPNMGLLTTIVSIHNRSV